MRRVCCWATRWQAISIDCCTARTQQARRATGAGRLAATRRSSTALSSKCEQCHIYRRAQHRHVSDACVACYSEKPSAELQAFFRRHFSNVTFIQGTVLDIPTLKLAKVCSAHSVVLSVTSEFRCNWMNRRNVNYLMVFVKMHLERSIFPKTMLPFLKCHEFLL